MSRGKSPHISRRASAMSSSVMSMLRSSQIPSRLRRAFFVPPSDSRESTKSRTFFFFSGGRPRRFFFVAVPTPFLSRPMHHFADEFFQFILARLHAPLGLPTDSFLHSIEAGLRLRQQQVRDRATHGLKRLEIDNCCLGLLGGN